MSKQHCDRKRLIEPTPAYASPEQLRGETVGTASDIYSLRLVHDYARLDSVNRVGFIR